MIKFYGYANCSTCRKAAKELEQRGVSFREIAIVEQPPTRKEIQLSLKQEGIEIKHLLNTSGVLYREMAIKDKLPNMSLSDVVDLLADHGKLIKRPFITDGRQVTLGFKDPKALHVWR